MIRPYPGRAYRVAIFDDTLFQTLSALRDLFGESSFKPVLQCSWAAAQQLRLAFHKPQVHCG